MTKRPRKASQAAFTHCAHQLRALEVYSHQQQIQVAEWAQGWHKLALVDSATGVKHQP